MDPESMLPWIVFPVIAVLISGPLAIAASASDAVAIRAAVARAR
jgi:hypothetical protein